MQTLHAASAALGILVLALSSALGQTTAGSATTIVVPVTAQTASFVTETTVSNPNGAAINVAVGFYEANNSPAPGPKVCAGLVVPANRSVQFTLVSQCTLGAGSHFGLLVLTEQTGSNPFYGYGRVQNPQGIGFSTEGFPAGNFNDQVSHAAGLKKTTTGLIFQTNCFVGSLAQPVSYTLKLFDDVTGAQIGGTLAGSLNAFEQFRYLDIFGANGVNAPNVDQLNVRAEFTPTTSANLIGFCTVQDNASFGADFRIAKSYGTPGTVTSLAQGTGITLTPNPITTTGTIAADTTYLQRRVTGTCAAGTSIRAIAADGTVTCETDDIGTGTVTSVGSGTGLTGGPITASGTLSVNTATIQARVTGTCGVGSSIRTVNSDGTVVCQPDTNSGGTVTSVATGTGLTGGPITLSGTISVAAGGISANELGAGAVTTSKIADGAVTTPKLADASITTAKLAAGAVTFDKLETSQRLPDCLDGQVIRRSSGAWICGSLPPTLVNLDNLGSVGQYTSLAIGADGFPIMAYQDVNNGFVKSAKCTNMSCTGTVFVNVVDGNSGVGTYISMAIGADGNPIISYRDGINTNLKVAQCVNASCSGSATLTTVDNAGDVGTFTSIAIGPDTFPVISYHDIPNGDLKVAKCTNAACTGSATITVVDSIGVVGQYTSLRIASDGFPVISYLGLTNFKLMVAKCSSADCSGAKVITPIDTVSNVGLWSSLVIGNDGLPVIAYSDFNTSDLKVAKCTVADCSTATLTFVDTVGQVGQHTAIAIGADGNPIISYWDQTNTALKVAKCANPACTGAAAITTVDNSGSVGQYTSIAIGPDGIPMISYFDASAFDVKFARCSNTSCLGP